MKVLKSKSLKVLVTGLFAVSSALFGAAPAMAVTPTVESVVLGSDGLTVTMNFSTTMDSWAKVHAENSTKLNVEVDGTRRAHTSAGLTLGNDFLILVLDGPPVTTGQIVQVNYNSTSGAKLRSDSSPNVDLATGSWIAVTQVTITYNENCPEDSRIDTVAVTLGESVQLAAIADLEYSCEGLDFVQWNTQANGEGEDSYEDEEFIEGGLDDDLTIYAIWSDPVTVDPTITFDSNFAGGPAAVEQDVEYGVETALNSLMFDRPGFVFSHWNDESDGSGDSYADGAMVTLESDLTLYAIWLAIDPVVPSVALPTIVSATAGNAQATVTWQIVQGPRDDAPTGYVIEFSTNGGLTWTAASSVSGTGLTRVVSGLTNGNSYLLRVTAVFGNNRATSAASSVVVPFDPTPVVKQTKTVVYRVTFAGSSSRLQAASRLRLQDIASELSGKNAQVTVTPYGVRGSAASSTLARTRGAAVTSQLSGLGLSVTQSASGTTATVSGSRVVWIKATYTE